MTQAAAGSRRKQSMTHEQFVALFDLARQTVSRAYIEAKVRASVSAVRQLTRGRSAGFAWSGGKDSQVLGLVCRLAGVRECVLGMTNLEYPAMLRWMTAHMPPRLEVINTGLDLPWLAARPAMLFPRNATIANAWFAHVQRAAWRQFAVSRDLELLILGGRRCDGNQCRDRTLPRTNCRATFPLAAWSHVDVFAAIHHYQLPLAPCYSWTRGYRCGTHPWPARQWCPSIADGWREIHAIDPAIVTFAAARLPSARAYLEQL